MEVKFAELFEEAYCEHDELKRLDKVAKALKSISSILPFPDRLHYLIGSKNLVKFLFLYNMDFAHATDVILESLQGLYARSNKFLSLLEVAGRYLGELIIVEAQDSGEMLRQKSATTSNNINSNNNIQQMLQSKDFTLQVEPPFETMVRSQTKSNSKTYENYTNGLHPTFAIMNATKLVKKFIVYFTDCAMILIASKQKNSKKQLQKREKFSLAPKNHDRVCSVFIHLLKNSYDSVLIEQIFHQLKRLENAYDYLTVDYEFKQKLEDILVEKSQRCAKFQPPPFECPLLHGDQVDSPQLGGQEDISSGATTQKNASAAVTPKNYQTNPSAKKNTPVSQSMFGALVNSRRADDEQKSAQEMLEDWLQNPKDFLHETVPLLSELKRATNSNLTTAFFKNTENIDLFLSFVFQPLLYPLASDVWGRLIDRNYGQEAYQQIQQVPTFLQEMFKQKQQELFIKQSQTQIESKSFNTLDIIAQTTNDASSELLKQNALNLRSYKATLALCNARNQQSLATLNSRFMEILWANIYDALREYSFAANINHVAKIIMSFWSRDHQLCHFFIVNYNIFFCLMPYLHLPIVSALLQQCIFSMGLITLVPKEQIDFVWHYFESTNFLQHLAELMVTVQLEDFPEHKAQSYFRPPQLNQYIKDPETLAQYRGMRADVQKALIRQQLERMTIEQAFDIKVDIDKIQQTLKRHLNYRITLNTLKRRRQGMFSETVIQQAKTAQLIEMQRLSLKQKSVIINEQSSSSDSEQSSPSPSIYNGRSFKNSLKEEVQQSKQTSQTSFHVRKYSSHSKSRTIRSSVVSSYAQIEEKAMQQSVQQPKKEQENQLKAQKNNHLSIRYLNNQNEHQAYLSDSQGAEKNKKKLKNEENSPQRRKSTDLSSKSVSQLRPFMMSQDQKDKYSGRRSQFLNLTTEDEKQQKKNEKYIRQKRVLVQSDLIHYQAAISRFSTHTTSYVSAEQTFDSSTMTLTKTNSQQNLRNSLTTQSSKMLKKIVATPCNSILVGMPRDIQRDQLRVNLLYPNAISNAIQTPLDQMANSTLYKIERLVNDEPFTYNCASFFNYIFATLFDNADSHTFMENMGIQKEDEYSRAFTILLAHDCAVYESLLQNFLFKQKLSQKFADNSALVCGKTVNSILNRLTMGDSCPLFRSGEFTSQIMLVTNRYFPLLVKCILSAFCAERHGTQLTPSPSQEGSEGQVCLQNIQIRQHIDCSQIEYLRTLVLSLEINLYSADLLSTILDQQVPAPLWHSLLLTLIENRTNNIATGLITKFLCVIVFPHASLITLHTVIFKCELLNYLRLGVEEAFNNGVYNTALHVDSLFIAVKQILSALKEALEDRVQILKQLREKVHSMANWHYFAKTFATLDLMSVRHTLSRQQSNHSKQKSYHTFYDEDKTPKNNNLQKLTLKKVLDMSSLTSDQIVEKVQAQKNPINMTEGSKLVKDHIPKQTTTLLQQSHAVVQHRRVQSSGILEKAGDLTVLINNKQKTEFIQRQIKKSQQKN